MWEVLVTKNARQKASKLSWILFICTALAALGFMPLPRARNPVLAEGAIEKSSHSQGKDNSVWASKSNYDGKSIAVSAWGSIKVVPDMAELQFTVEGSGVSFIGSILTCSQKVRKLVDFLQEEGIPFEDIFHITEQFITKPNDEDTSSSGEYKNIKTLYVEVYDLEKLDPIFKGVQDLENVSLEAIRFQKTDLSYVYDLATQKAKAMAELQAQQIAKINGLKLDPIPTNISVDAVVRQFSSYSEYIRSLKDLNEKENQAVDSNNFYGMVPLNVNLVVTYRVVDAK